MLEAEWALVQTSRLVAMHEDLERRALGLPPLRRGLIPPLPLLTGVIQYRTSWTDKPD